jgi:hypothetical protein
MMKKRKLPVCLTPRSMCTSTDAPFASTPPGRLERSSVSVVFRRSDAPRARAQALERSEVFAPIATDAFESRQEFLARSLAGKNDEREKSGKSFGYNGVPKGNWSFLAPQDYVVEVGAA